MRLTKAAGEGMVWRDAGRRATWRATRRKGGAVPYAIAQKDLTPPSADRMVRAFEAVPELTHTDAVRLTRNAFGILVRNLAGDRARTLQRALSAEGVETDIVNQTVLPKLPGVKRLPRAAVSDGGISFGDMYGRSQRVIWDAVVLVAAGRVNTGRREFQTRFSTKVRVGYRGSVSKTVVAEKEYEHGSEWKLLLDIVVARPSARYRIWGEKFNYAYLGARRQSQRWANFSLLGLDIVNRAKRAGYNMGAASLLDDPRTTYDYPGLGAFEEEMTWLLWKGGVSL